MSVTFFLALAFIILKKLLLARLFFQQGNQLSVSTTPDLLYSICTAGKIDVCNNSEVTGESLEKLFVRTDTFGALYKISRKQIFMFKPVE